MGTSGLGIPSRRPGPPRRRWLAVLLALAGALSGCGAGTGSRSRPHEATATTAASGVPTTGGPSSTTSTVAPPLPVKPVVWTPCAGGLQCGSVTVPLDYAQPDGPTIAIAVARHPATDPAARIGSIVINPGGPGLSGIDDLPEELQVLTPGLLARFDIVSFDPRGVDRSSPVTCGPGSTGPPGDLPDPTPTTPAAEQALLTNDQAFAAACEQASGSILDDVGTVDTAMDLDRIRAAIGDATLTYIGHSYGTLLGETYAELYPTHVRAMVLDSVIDPSISTLQMVSDQAVGFEGVLDDFFTWCAGTPACAWRPAGSPQGALLSMIAASRAQRLTGYGGRTVGPGEYYDALLASLYSQSSWPTLGSALARAQAGDGAGLLALSDGYTTNGSTNLADASTAITCLDHPSPSNASLYPALAAASAQSAPVFGPLLTWGVLGCGVWEAPATRLPMPISAPGSPPILVVGTTHDPATPYKWAVHVAAMLPHGVLVTVDGVDHVAYYYSACVRAIDQAYLINLTTPPAGTTCPED